MSDNKTFGTDDDRRLSADGTLEPAPSPPPPPQPARSRDTPYSPRPRLFDNLPLPEGPVASDVLSEADYRRLRSNAFRPSVLVGPLAMSSLLAPKFLPSRSNNPNIVRSGIFLFSLTSFMTIQTYFSLSREISGARYRAFDRVRPRTEDGELIILPQTEEIASSGSASGSGRSRTVDQYALAAEQIQGDLAGPGNGEGGAGGRFQGHGKGKGRGATIGNAPLREALQAKGQTLGDHEDDEILANLGRAKARTRWAKGKGLDGEVEEENEMRDTFFRPGVPRKPA